MVSIGLLAVTLAGSSFGGSAVEIWSATLVTGSWGLSANAYTVLLADMTLLATSLSFLESVVRFSAMV